MRVTSVALAKRSFGVLHESRWKHPNELFGHPSAPTRASGDLGPQRPACKVPFPVTCPEAAERVDVGDCGGGGGGRPEPGGPAGAAAVHDHPARALQGAGQTHALRREEHAHR